MYWTKNPWKYIPGSGPNSLCGIKKATSIISGFTFSSFTGGVVGPEDFQAPPPTPGPAGENLPSFHSPGK